MKVFVLIIMYATSNNWVPVTQEFSSEVTCQAAAKHLMDFYKSKSAKRAISVACLKK